MNAVFGRVLIARKTRNVDMATKKTILTWNDGRLETSRKAVFILAEGLIAADGGTSWPPNTSPNGEANSPRKRACGIRRGLQ